MITKTYKVLIGFFILCFSIQFLFIVFQNPYLQNKYLNRGILVFVTLGFALLSLIFYKLFEKHKAFYTLPRTLLILSILLVGFFVIQLLFIKHVYVNPSWDFGVVYRNVQAVICDGSELAPTKGDKIYFTRFGNNKGILLLLCSILKGMQNIGFSINETNILSYCLVINCIFVQLALWLAAAIFLREKKNYAAVYLVLVMIFGMILLFYCPIFYTDTFALFIPLLLYHLALSYEKRPSFWYIPAFTATIILGYLLKLTSVFVLLAYFVYLILSIKKETMRKSVRQILPLGIAVLLFLLLLYPVDHFAKGRIGITEEMQDQYEIPYSHWIMMGMYESKDIRVGGYSAEAYEYTQQFSTLSERKKMTLKKAKEILQERGIKGELGYLMRKGVFTWGDGLLFSIDLLSREQQRPEGLYQRLYDVKRGHEQEGIAYYATGFYYAILFYVILSLWFMLFRKEVKQSDIARIVIMGLYVFLMIWETTPRYIFCYLPFLYFITVETLDDLDGMLQLKKRRIKNGTEENEG